MKKGRRQNFIMSPACLWFVLAVLAYNVCDVKAKAYMATLEIKDEQRPDRSRRSADMIDPSSYRLDVKEAMVHFLRRDKDMHLDDDDNGHSHGQGQINGNGDDDDAVDDAAQARIDREAAEMLASMVNDINARLFTLAENIKELMRSQYLLNSRLAAVETAIGVGNVLGSLFPVRPEPTPKAPSTTTSLPTPQPTSTSAESGSQVDMAKQLLDNAADDIDEAIDLLQEGGQSSQTSIPPHGVAIHATAMSPHATTKKQTAMPPHPTPKQQTAMEPHPTPKQQTVMPPHGDMQQQSMLPHGNPQQQMEMSTRVNAPLTATTSQGNMKPHTTIPSHGSTSSSPQTDSGTGQNHNHQSNGGNHGNHEDEGVNNHGNQGNYNDDQQTVSEEPTAIDATENDNDNGGGTVIEEKELPHGFRPYSFRRYNPFTDARRGDLLNRIRVSLAHRAVPVGSQPGLPRPRLSLAEDSYRRKNTP
ncbi:uncharacterized protein [Diadema setosum]|uniref:uncharacterized protein n=1 Tax=Diadema setosum TaxID=31175 RepID=UPI003B3AC353